MMTILPTLFLLASIGFSAPMTADALPDGTQDGGASVPPSSHDASGLG